MKTHRLLKAIEILVTERGIVKDDTRSGKDEIFEIVTEFLEAVYQSAGVQELEHRVDISRKVDTTAIGDALNTLKTAKPPQYTLQFPDNKSRTIDPVAEIAGLEDALKTIEDKQTQLGRLEVLLRIELYFDAHFNDILMAFEPDNEVFGALIKLVGVKLEAIKNDEILLLWARLKSVFAEDQRRSGFKVYDDIIPNEFWSEPADIAVLRRRLSEFICKYKPLTIRRMITDGFTSFPVALPGVARILSAQATIDRITNMDILLIRAISRVVALCDAATYKEAGDIARAIGANPGSLIFDGEYYREYKNVVQGNRAESLRLLHSNMARLLEYSEEASVNRSNVSEALWRFKMGQEIIAPSRNKELLKRKQVEVSLQKEVSKFLIERGILSFGRTFGRNEIDLYTKETGGEEFVIEAKAYQRSPRPTEIESNVVQLQSYMDQISQPRGVLALFNFSDDLVMAPRRWLKGRIWVLAINLCPKSASLRKRSLEITESSRADRLIDCIETGAELAGKKKVVRKKSSRK